MPSKRQNPIDLSLYPPKGWSIDLWRKVLKIANRMSRQELILAWIEASIGSVSDAAFNRMLSDLAAFSRQELIDLIHEVGPEGGKRLLQRYGHYSPPEEQNSHSRRFVV